MLRRHTARYRHFPSERYLMQRGARYIALASKSKVHVPLRRTSAPSASILMISSQPWLKLPPPPEQSPPPRSGPVEEENALTFAQSSEMSPTLKSAGGMPMRTRQWPQVPG